MSQDDALERSIGERLRTARMRRHMSLALLASEIGVTYQQVRKYEAGTNRISASTLFKVAALLDVDVAYFFPTQPSKESADAPSGDAAGGDGALASALARIDDVEVRRRMVELIRAVEGLDRRS